MGLAKDISHLSPEEQEKVLKQREQTRRRRERESRDPERYVEAKKNNRDSQVSRLRTLRERQKAGEKLNILDAISLASQKLAVLRHRHTHREALKSAIQAKHSTEDGRKERNQTAKNQRAKNPDRYRQYWREWHHKASANDPQHKLNSSLRSTLRTTLKTQYLDGDKVGSATRDLGCSMLEFKDHLETQFQTGMTWDNYGRKGPTSTTTLWWELDHIVPLANFDLTDREQFLKAAHYTNIQPLWNYQNRSKGDRIEVGGETVRARDVRKKAA